MKKITFAFATAALTVQLVAQNASRRPVDNDGDGKISRKEFPGPDDLFKSFDTNQDGFIDQKEREAMRAARRGGRGGFGGGQGQEMPLRDFFHTLDANGNQQISAKEWELLCKPEDFKLADSDKNGHVAPEELFLFLGQGQGNRPGGGGFRPGGGGRERPDRGPAVGGAAPKVIAKTMTDEKLIDLSKVTRPTVLVFGSYT